MVVMNEKQYWLHRVSYEGGLEILERENRLTIGFSAVAKSVEACEAMDKRNYAEFCKAYTAIYKGAIERNKNGLWRFVTEMAVGDIVVVPFRYGFSICCVSGDAIVCNRGNRDLGWEREVKTLAKCSPREDYACSGLLSRMKCQQTNLCINDLSDEVDDALRRKQGNEPLRLLEPMSEQLLEKLKTSVSPSGFERFVASYFKSLGAQAIVLTKNVSDKHGDCDVEAVFPSIRLTVCVQCKHHVGTTDDWAVRQISDYAENRGKKGAEDNWTYAYWVVSLADKYNDDAYRLARENGVTLINGMDFCRMCLNAGIR